MRPLAVLASALVLLWPSVGRAEVARVSLSSGGEQGDAGSSQPSVSANGRFVAFTSLARNLVSGDLYPMISDVLLHDRDMDADGIFDEPGAIATTRVSRRADGASANGNSGAPSITSDGRFVVFVSTATDLVAGVGSALSQVYRYDRTNDQIVLVSANDAGAAGDHPSSLPGVSDDGRYVVFQSIATNLGGAGSGPAIFLRDLQTSKTSRLSQQLPPDPAPTGAWSLSAPSISDDGSRVAFAVVLHTSYINYEISPDPRVTLTGSIHIVSTVDRSESVEVDAGLSVWLSEDGTNSLRTFQMVTGTLGLRPPNLYWRHHETNESFLVSPNSGGLTGWSGMGQLAVVGRSVFDLRYRRAWLLPFEPLSGDLSSGGRFLAFESVASTLVPGDTNAAADILVLDLAAFFDADSDTLDDRWETFFGMSTSSSSDHDGPAGDPDGDGATNAQEQRADTHPRGTSVRQLAEGAGGSFFETRYEVFNPSTTRPATALAIFSSPEGETIHRPLSIDPRRRDELAASAVAGLSGEFSATLESDSPLVVERTITWAGSDRYGSHAETAIAAPSATWFIAEGSIVAGFNLFYLLQNPQSVAATATVRFLRPSEAPVVRTYELLPRSRLTIHVNEVPGLDESDVAGAVEATQPIVVERTMYADRAGQLLGLGHGGLGAPRLSPTWYLAEGATGPFFDTYVVIANPSASPAALTVRFLTDRGTTVTREVTVAAERRVSLFVEAIAGLEHSSFATIVTSTNGVPVVVERAMYWPGGFYDYYEGHSSVGVTAPASRWATAGGREGGVEDARTYVLIANVSDTPGQVRISALRPIVGVLDLVLDVAPNSRATVPLRWVLTPEEISSSQRFPVVVESLGETPVPIVVERATYTTVNGVVWAAGANAFATPLP
jgi:hypothetical protein